MPQSYMLNMHLLPYMANICTSHMPPLQCPILACTPNIPNIDLSIKHIGLATTDHFTTFRDCPISGVRRRRAHYCPPYIGHSNCEASVFTRCLLLHKQRVPGN